MLAYAAAPLTPAAVTEAGRVFVVPGPPLPWLAPALILAGIALQLAVLARLHRGRAGLTRGAVFLCAAGACLVFVGAALERDVSVAVGEALALTGIWFAWRKR